MAENIAEYVRAEKRGFDEKGLTDVDLLVFAAALYFEFERFPHYLEAGVSTRLADMAAHGRLVEYAEHDYNPADMLELAEALAESPRFGCVPIERFECIVGDDPAIQFAAACFPVSDELVVVAYRGTDAHLVGWQEDFEMLWREAAPGQLEALRYLREAAAAYPNVELALCGHSKGGACAEYAAVFANSQLSGRIVRACSFDGQALFKVGGAADLDLEAYDRALLERYGQIDVPLVRYVFPSSIGLLMERRDAGFILASPGFVFAQSIDPEHEHNICAVRVRGGEVIIEAAGEDRVRKSTGAVRIMPSLSGAERRFATNAVVEACRYAGITVSLTDEGVKQLFAALRAWYKAAPRNEKRQARRLMAKVVFARK
ncbi:MAG: DUF2974 domain-containing protein [Eggerthellaceae bacterium]|nr:DUF2974 domain-containing protein [Eggerthellaceae bacterium]MBQ9044297.1 DUF2974 domain-containing protein [Eggerthellaceae bacterium]